MNALMLKKVIQQTGNAQDTDDNPRAKRDKEGEVQMAYKITKPSFKQKAYGFHVEGPNRENQLLKNVGQQGNRSTRQSWNDIGRTHHRPFNSRHHLLFHAHSFLDLNNPNILRKEGIRVKDRVDYEWESG